MTRIVMCTNAIITINTMIFINIHTVTMHYRIINVIIVTVYHHTLIIVVIHTISIVIIICTIIIVTFRTMTIITIHTIPFTDVSTQ